MRIAAPALALGVSLLPALPAAAPPATAAPPASPYTSTLPGSVPWKGDLDGMRKRRRIRALVPYSKTTYYVEKGVPSGMSYEALVAFEEKLNAKPGTGKPKTLVVFIPTPRDQLLPALLDGRGDIAAGALTITEERRKVVDFSEPLATGVKEIVVTGTRSPVLRTVDDLAGQEVMTRRSSSYWEHLERLNERFAKEGRPLVKLRASPETLQDEDLLEMLNAGLFAIGVVDTYKADLWVQVFKGLRAHPDLVVNEGGQVAWAMRPGSPLLKAEVDPFVKAHRIGTLFGNTVRRRYLGNPRFVEQATADAEVRKFDDVVPLFERYASRYSLDALLMMAQGYQESRLEQSARSPGGAIGVMQVRPATGRDMKVGDIAELEANIHAGVKYVRFMIDTYFAREPMDPLNKGLFAFAAYNAGPGRIQKLRRLARERGLDPNQWFGNVELVTAERLGAETVTYVSNIYKYYVAYTLVAERAEERRKAREAVEKAKS